MKWVSALLLAVLATIACGVGGTDIKHHDIPTLNGKKGQFDFAAFEPKTHLFFAADKTDHGIDVFDDSQGEPVFRQTIGLGTEPHGLTLVPELGKLFVGNLDGTVQAIDVVPTGATFLKVVAKIKTGAPKGIDLMGWDPREQRLFASAPDSSTLFDIDPVKNVVVKAINTKKGIEEPVYNAADGMLYLMVNPANSIYKIDPARDHIVSETTLGVACGPYGMAINQKTQQAMITCDKVPVLWDLKREKVIRTFNEVGAGDQVLYDAGTDRFLVPGINQNFIVAIFGGNPVRFYNSIQTHSDSKAIAFDPEKRIVFQPQGTRNQSGAISFTLPDPEPEGPNVWLPIIYLLGLVAAGTAIWFYGKRKADERRRLGRPMFS